MLIISNLISNSPKKKKTLTQAPIKTTTTTTTTIVNRIVKTQATSPIRAKKVSPSSDPVMHHRVRADKATITIAPTPQIEKATTTITTATITALANRIITTATIMALSSPTTATK